MLAQLAENPLWLPIIAIGGAVALLALVLVAPWWIKRRRRRVAEVAPPTLQVNVAALPAEGPPEQGPSLRLYNVPVRCALLVLAPVGRGAVQPAADKIGEIIDQVVPGLASVAEAHRTAIKVWSAQLSSQGFLHQFSVNVGLPGDAGKGTPWSSVCGRFEAQSVPYLVGLLLCAARPNSLGQFLVERESQWPDMLRVVDE
ncbi:MAG: hypothetical protein SGJ19_13635 [Planctomycetia bacterium]|nr:hypothetical protein [Planctomycetia bacterium]